MSKKIFPNNKIIVKKSDEILNFDYVAPPAQQIFNFVVALALNMQKNVINIKASDYFSWACIQKPQGKHYTLFYKNLEVLKHTFIVVQSIENNKKVKYEWPLIAQAKTIKTMTDKTENIEITFNAHLLDFYKWQRANVPINIDITKNLTEKYAYKLYEFLRYYDRQKGKNKNIAMNDLRRILTVPANESNVRFLRYLEKALKNINETTELKIQAKSRAKNKKSLAKAEIKFENVAEKIAQKQFEFLQFERDFRAQNAD